MTTEFLSAWEMAVIREAMLAYQDRVHLEHGAALVAKLERASHFRLTYPTENKPA